MPYKTLLVGLSMHGDETPIIDEAVRLANSFGAQLIAIHVNDPNAGSLTMMMDSPGKLITEEMVRDCFRNAGHEEIAQRMDVRIPPSESIPQAIKEASQNADLLILGHKRMSYFKEHFLDSIDEGIVNHVNCPVLLVQKDG
ncbi:MAG: universal stress protein [FCB group bacterium]|nr:universal stress protein [FCB group bacterium]